MKIILSSNSNFLNLTQFLCLFSFYLLHLKVFTYLISLLFKIASCYLELVDLMFNYQIEIAPIAVAAAFAIFLTELLKLEAKRLMEVFQF